MSVIVGGDLDLVRVLFGFCLSGLTPGGGLGGGFAVVRMGGPRQCLFRHLLFNSISEDLNQRSPLFGFLA